MNISRIFLNKVLQSSLHSLSSLPSPCSHPPVFQLRVLQDSPCPATKSHLWPAKPLQNNLPVPTGREAGAGGRKEDALWSNPLPRAERAQQDCCELFAGPPKSPAGGLAPLLGLGLLGAMLLFSAPGSVWLCLNRR